jgi:hypothetical protein
VGSWGPSVLANNALVRHGNGVIRRIQPFSLKFQLTALEGRELLRCLLMVLFDVRRPLGSGFQLITGVEGFGRGQHGQVIQVECDSSG